MTVDLSEFRDLGGVSGGVCVTGRLLKLWAGTEDGAKLEAALAAPKGDPRHEPGAIQDKSISRWLLMEPRKVSVASQTIGRHRNGVCLCQGVRG